MNGSTAVRRWVGLLALATTACGLLEGFHISASNLQIGPNPAVPGDEVVATFFYDVAPLMRHTIIFSINDQEHLRFDSTELPSRPYVLSLGDAADLITEYGTGTHSARIEIRVDEKNESAKTQSFSFELRAAP